ncbi:hypothetical protein ABQG65_08820 [Yersinia alsatica]|uniref:hypothetical protein n=1 Tax=Yersinia alsatica TaxID=2890317 RepID=UPI0032EC8A2E
MSDKIAVVYIGPKEKKRDTVTGSRLIFPRHEAVEVEGSIAHQLLDFPSVFIRYEELEGMLAREKAAELELAEYDAALVVQAELEALQHSFVLNMGETDVDIAKLTSIQLATLVESEELDLKQNAQEKVDDFRLRVRDAIQQKYTSTESEHKDG